MLRHGLTALFTVGVHVIPGHLRRGQALSKGVHVVVLLLQGGEAHLLLLDVTEGGAQVLQLRGQAATGGRCEAQEEHRRNRSEFSNGCYSNVLN